MILWTAILIVLAGIIGGVSINYLGDDKPVEEMAEAIIEEYTGINIDLSPKSPEISEKTKLKTERQ